MKEVLIDHTALDIWLADGRPVIRTLIDANTQRVVGFHLKFEDDADTCVSNALRASIERNGDQS